MALRHLHEARAQDLRAARAREQPPPQRAQIEPGAARDDRKPAAVDDRRDGRGGKLDVISSGELRVGIDDVEKMVRHASTSLEGQLRGPDVETSVDLERIAADHFAAVALTELDGELALARARRADDGDERRRHSLSQRNTR